MPGDAGLDEFSESIMSAIISQCELWTDNVDMPDYNTGATIYTYNFRQENLPKVAEDVVSYKSKTEE